MQKILEKKKVIVYTFLFSFVEISSSDVIWLEFFLSVLTQRFVTDHSVNCNQSLILDLSILSLST